jgi:hypothetical protein
MLVHKKVSKEHDTPHPLILCVAHLHGRQSKLALTSHIKRDLLRSSNSRLPNAPIKLALLDAAEGAGGRPSHFPTGLSLCLAKRKEPKENE